jgi:hypothetical protein
MQHMITIKAETKWPLDPRQIEALFSTWLKDQWKADPSQKDSMPPSLGGVQVTTSL